MIIEHIYRKRIPMYTNDNLSNIKALEDRFDAENKLILAIASGLIPQAETTLTEHNFLFSEASYTDPLRVLQNHCIVMNTLFRKGVEQASVHPLHIAHLSARFMRRIEVISSEEEARALLKEMLHKYCLLVKNHSMKGFSPVIQKVLTRIDSDLTADLSLRTQAELLDVNASYLSTLFKKEIGITLTEYVNQKRINHAVFLLNTTDMQIQSIAQHCGIPDFNYFTKIFKKYIGKTPKEYRGVIS